MYVPRPNAEDPSKIAEHVRRWPFATVVTSGSLGLFGSHVPLVLAGPDRLVGHVARANPHHDDFFGPALAIFLGPHAFVSSRWYGEPLVHVPTWNYVAVHATGTIRPTGDPLGALSMLMSLMQPHDLVPSGDRDRDEFVDGLTRAIVPFEIEVTRWDAKAKLSQNRDEPDQGRVVEALLARGAPGDAEVAAEMVRRRR